MDVEEFIKRHDPHKASCLIRDMLGDNLKEMGTRLLKNGRFIWQVIVPVGYDLASLRQTLRPQLFDTGWLYVTFGTECHFFGIGPVISRTLTTAYHATRQAVVRKIKTEGLLVSNAERNATGFPDTEGVVHISANLRWNYEDGDGVIHWRNNLSQKNRFDDTQWTILEIDMREVSGGKVYEDWHSSSGIVIEGVDRIPPQFIKELPDGATIQDENAKQENVNVP